MNEGTQEQVSLNIYELEPERIFGMGEGEHSAPILKHRGGMKISLTISELRNLKATDIFFYRLADGTPYGPGRFALFEDDPENRIKWYVLLEPDVDIY